MLLRNRDELLKACGVPYGHFGQHFSVDLYVSVFESVDELTVSEPKLPCSGPYPCYPQTAEVSLSFPAVAVGVAPCVNECFLGPFIVPMGGPTVASCQRNNFLVPPAFGNATFNPCQNYSPRT